MPTPPSFNPPDIDLLHGELDTQVSVLAIGAHPDDVDWCCSGLLLHERNRGRKTAIVDLTRGEAGTRGTPELRRKEATDAAKLLGLACRAQLDFGDGVLEPTLENSFALAHVIRRLKPTLILTCYPEDKHPDHAAAGQVTDRAFYHAKMKHFDLGAPIWSPTAVLYYNQHYYREPDLVIDIQDVAEEKMQVALSFSSQFGAPLTNLGESYKPLGINDYRTLLETRMRQYGSYIGSSAGEGYQYRQPLQVQDPVTFFGG